MGRFPLPNWGGAGEGGTCPLPGKKCKLHAERVQFGVYFASYEVAHKINEHRLAPSTGGDRPLPPYGSATALHCIDTLTVLRPFLYF